MSPLSTAHCLLVSIRRLRLDPFKVTFLPDIGKPYKEYRYKDHHLNQGEKAQTLVDHSPGEEKDDLYVEYYEDQSYNVKPYVELYPGSALRVPRRTRRASAFQVSDHWRGRFWLKSDLPK